MAKKKVSKKQAVDDIIRSVRQVRGALGGGLTIPELTQALRSLHSAEDVKLDAAHAQERNEQQVACLKKSLQAAVTLEFATIPPYLSAMWSIKDELHPATVSIREVVQEEMLHMALACNMLASLGETPQITSAVPQYPGGLPGGVHKGLIVGLEGLTKKSLADFLWIERPLEEVPIDHPYDADAVADFKLKKLAKEHPTDETIGEFYEEIRHAFAAYLENPANPPLTPDNQVTGPLAKAVIQNMDNVDYAISTIQDQGEGSPNDPEEHEGDLSHYYRFLEVYNEQKYKWNAKKKVLEVAGKLPWPDVRPMAAVPAGGYLKEDVSDEVWHYLEKFDNTYSKLLDLLQSAWTVGGQASLIHAYDVMFDLEWSARPLMDTRLPFGGGLTYGPCWRYNPNWSDAAS